MPQMSQDKKAEKFAKLARVTECLASGMTFSEAAQAAGINRRTLHRWVSEDTDLARAALKAKDSADDMVEAVTFRNAMNPDPAHNTLRMFWLKSRRPDVYRETVKQVVEDARKSYETANAPENL